MKLETKYVDKIIAIGHGSGGKSTYLEQILSREDEAIDKWLGRQYQLWGTPRHGVDGVIMGHYHRHGKIESRSGRLLAINAAWKLSFPYKSMSFLGEHLMPSIGGMRITATKHSLEYEFKTFPTVPIRDQLRRG